MNLVFGQDQRVADYVTSKTMAKFSAPFTTIGIEDKGGALIGGFIFNDYTGSSIHMSLAGSAAIKRSIWAAVANYVFVQSGCSRLEIKTSKGNRMVRKIAPRFGFRFEGVAKDYYGEGHDALMFALTKRNVLPVLRKWRAVK